MATGGAAATGAVTGDTVTGGPAPTGGATATGAVAGGGVPTDGASATGAAPTFPAVAHPARTDNVVARTTNPAHVRIWDLRILFLRMPRTTYLLVASPVLIGG